MYINYGDKDFFQNGILVDSQHSDTEFSILRCLPYDDDPDRYMFAELTVNIDDGWIDKKAVMNFIGMNDINYDPVWYAIGCTDYYSWSNFGANDYNPYTNWRNMDKESIKKFLKTRLIASDRLNITW